MLFRRKPATEAEVRERAADLISKPGAWHPYFRLNKWGHKAGPREKAAAWPGTAAIHEVSKDATLFHAAMDKLNAACPPHIDLAPFAGWEREPGRTADEVAALLRNPA